MTIANLNRQTIAALPAGEGLYWDTTLKGFGYLCRQDASGAIRKSFIIQYRFNGQQRKLKLGDAAKLNVDQARKKAEKLFAQILLGTDPQAVKEAGRIEAARLTFAQAVEQYLETKKAEVRPASFKLAQLYLCGTRYFPTLHRKALDDVTRSDIAQHLDRVNAESGAPTASRARSHISSLFTWCLRRGLCRENPVSATESFKTDSARERVLSADELRQVWDKCDMDSDYGRIVRLLILTGARREEIGGLRWSASQILLRNFKTPFLVQRIMQGGTRRVLAVQPFFPQKRRDCYVAVTVRKRPKGYNVSFAGGYDGEAPHSL